MAEAGRAVHTILDRDGACDSSEQRRIAVTDSAWISNVLADPELVLLMETDIVAADADRAIEALNMLKAGRPVPPELCPKQVWGGETAEWVNGTPDLFLANTYPIVSERAADVLRRFDLGGGGLYPVDEVLQKDRATPVPGSFFCWIFGNSKSAFAATESPDARPFAGPNSGRWKMPFVHKDDQMAVSGAALGGPDVWVDPTLFKSVFVSGRLGDALDEAGLRKAFRLYRCRVV
ncbi:MAG TPA: hypothetical protein VF079_10665 [Sphingomicrobium sp.]